MGKEEAADAGAACLAWVAARRRAAGCDAGIVIWIIGWVNGRVRGERSLGRSHTNRTRVRFTHAKADPFGTDCEFVYLEGHAHDLREAL